MRLLAVVGVFGVMVVVGLGACGGDDSTGGAPPDDDGGGADGTTILPDGAVDPTDSAKPGPSCGAAGVKTGFAGTQTIASGGAQRTYELFVPDAYDGRTTYPLVFVFHGDGGTGANIRGSFKLEAEAAGGAIFVYPDGENKTWVIDQAAATLRDVAFIDAVAADLAKTHCGDPKRVFAVGFSKGAYFANQLACVSKSGLRAVVAHSGGGPFGLTGLGTTFDGSGNLVCPQPPVAAMQIIGTADGLLGDAQKARDYYKRVNACGAGTTTFDPSPCGAFDGCNAARPEIYCEIPAMGHQIWSSAPKAVWAFLKSK